MFDVGTTVHFRRQNTPWPHFLEACKWPKELAVVVGVAVQKLPPYFVFHRFSVHTGHNCQIGLHPMLQMRWMGWVCICQNVPRNVVLGHLPNSLNHAKDLGHFLSFLLFGASIQTVGSKIKENVNVASRAHFTENNALIRKRAHMVVANSCKTLCVSWVRIIPSRSDLVPIHAVQGMNTRNSFVQICLSA